MEIILLDSGEDEPGAAREAYASAAAAVAVPIDEVAVQAVEMASGGGARVAGVQSRAFDGAAKRHYALLRAKEGQVANLELGEGGAVEEAHFFVAAVKAATRAGLEDLSQDVEFSRPRSTQLLGELESSLPPLSRLYDESEMRPYGSFGEDENTVVWGAEEDEGELPKDTLEEDMDTGDDNDPVDAW